jgi:ATP-dependent helicase HrpB
VDYPVLEILADLKTKLLHNKVVILQAPPGAGKSTILPLHLLDEPWLGKKKIIMLEPRRLAARAVATRMASLRDEAVGATVGFRIRFENNVSAETQLEVVTEGILTRKIQNDNTLDGIGLVIFDEFHERSLQADLALALCVQVQQVLREDLRILIMSATLDGEGLSLLLGNAPVITSQGKLFPIEFRYYNFDPEAPIAVRMARAIRKALQENSGDVLAFFPGAGEIKRAQDLLETEGVGADLYPLYGDLSMRKQQEAILPDPHGRRKVVLATSLAETSLTIEGITVVIDCGYSRIPKFDPRSGLTRLDTVRITKDSATQRAGRSGRLGPGVCYRLWSEGLNASLVAARSPEILESDLAPMMLELAQWGVKKMDEIIWITQPPAGAVAQATELLEQLEAIKDKTITARGKRMLQLPTHPRIAHMLLSAEGNDRKLLALATDVAALLEERDPLGKTAGVDLTLRLEALRKWRAGERVSAERNILERLERLAESWRKIFKIQSDNSIPVDTEVGKLVVAAYPERIAQQTQKGSERYKLANGRIVKLPDHDALMRDTWLSVAHLDAGSGEGKIFLAAPLNHEDLYDLAYEEEVIRWDATRGMVTGALEKRMGNLVLETKPLATIPSDKRIKILCEVVRKEGLKILGWSDAEDQWQARVMSLKTWRPEEPWPDVSEENLLNTIEEWLSAYLTQAHKLTDLARLDLKAILTGILPYEIYLRIETLAPSALEVPSGSMIPLKYFSHGQSPVMEVRLQEVFGLLETPAVNQGKERVIMHLLSPGYKPVQVTQDLKSFWQTAYHEVRSELRIRYRKHSWPEDPWTAKAVRGVVKKRNG